MFTIPYFTLTFHSICIIHRFTPKVAQKLLTPAAPQICENRLLNGKTSIVSMNKPPKKKRLTAFKLQTASDSHFNF